VDNQVEWLKSRPATNRKWKPNIERASSEQVRVAEDLHELYSTAGVLVVDVKDTESFQRKIASTVHDTFHALCLRTRLPGKTTPELFGRINLRLARSVTARNALGRSEKESAQEIATMLYGEVRPMAIFDSEFGHPPPQSFRPNPNSWTLIKAGWCNFCLGLQLAR